LTTNLHGPPSDRLRFNRLSRRRPSRSTGPRLIGAAGGPLASARQGTHLSHHAPGLLDGRVPHLRPYDNGRSAGHVPLHARQLAAVLRTCHDVLGGSRRFSRRAGDKDVRIAAPGRISLPTTALTTAYTASPALSGSSAGRQRSGGPLNSLFLPTLIGSLRIPDRHLVSAAPARKVTQMAGAVTPGRPFRRPHRTEAGCLFGICSNGKAP
jgi:hypothetical protein